MNEFITMLKIRSLCEKRKTCIKETGEGGIDKCPLFDPCNHLAFSDLTEGQLLEIAEALGEIEVDYDG